MRKILIAVAGCAAAAAACTISFTPARDTAFVGDTVKLKVLVTNSHVPCMLSIDASKFCFEKAHLAASDSVWKKLGPTKYEKNLLVVVDSVGTATVKATRKCDIKQTTGSASILVQPRPAPKPKKS